MLLYSTDTRRTTVAIALVGALLLLVSSCHHAQRVSPATLQRLRVKNAPFTLVFGKLSTDSGQVKHLTIRVVRQLNRTSPEYVLWSWTVTNGGRFFAVLQTPPDLPFLDEFYVEVGDAVLGFDRVLFVRLQKSDPPSAMYVGDLHISPAPNRTIQGPALKVEVRDSFEAAAKELKRLYPNFDAPVTKAALFRSPVPMTVERR